MLRRRPLGSPSPMNYGGAVQRLNPHSHGGTRYMGQYSGPDPCYDCADISGIHLCSSCADEYYYPSGGQVYNIVMCSCPHCEYYNDPGVYGGGYPSPSYPRANYTSGNRRQRNSFAAQMMPFFTSGYGGAYGGGRGFYARGGAGRMGYRT